MVLLEGNRAVIASRLELCRGGWAVENFLLGLRTSGVGDIFYNDYDDVVLFKLYMFISTTT